MTEASVTVLVVDDEELVRSVTKLMLERLGYRVLTAVDGVDAVEVFTAHADEVGLALLDMTMPRMGGIEACQALRAIRPGLKVVLASGYSEQDAAERFEGQGIAVFLQKPFQLPTLRDKIASAIAS